MLPNSLRPNSLAPWAESSKTKLWRPTCQRAARPRELSEEAADGGGIDGDRARLGRRVGRLARVQLQRLEVLGEVGHGGYVTQAGRWQMEKKERASLGELDWLGSKQRLK